MPSISRVNIFFTKKSRSITFLDLDGTVWADTGAAGILRRNRLLVKPSLRQHFQIPIVLITNQTLFARETDLSLVVLLRYIFSWLRILWSLKPVAVLICHHHPNARQPELRSDCAYRKPSALMILKLGTMMRIDYQNSIIVGDRISDVIAGNRANLSLSFLVNNCKMFENNESSNYLQDDYALFRTIDVGQLNAIVSGKLLDV